MIINPHHQYISVTLFDIYQDSQIEAGKKSAAFSIVLRAKDRTLTDEEADRAVGRAVKAVEALGARLRK